MTQAHQPALLVSCGESTRPVAARVVALAAPTELLRVVGSADDAGAELAAIAEHVRGYTLVHVLHLVDTEEPAALDRTRRSMEAVADADGMLPAIQVSQWAIALVGIDWTDSETTIVDLLAHDSGQPRALSGLVVASRSNEAQALVTLDDEQVMAAELAYTFLTTPSLFSDLAVSRTWAAGLSSIHYRRSLLVAAVAAYHTVSALDATLLAPARANQPYGELGEQWVTSLHIESADHFADLLRGPVGGSVLSQLRPDPSMFRSVPLEALPDALASYFDMLAADELDQAYRQIDRNSAEQTDKLLAALSTAVLDTLRDSLSIANADEFARGIDRELARVELRVAAALVAEQEEDPDPEPVLTELEKTIRRLPYGAAILARIAAFAAAGAAMGQIWFGGGPSSWAMLIAGAIGAGLAALPLFVKYRLGLRRIRDLRDKYLRRKAKKLEIDCRIHALRRLLVQVQELRAAVTAADREPPAWLPRLSAFSAALTALRQRYANRIASRADHSLPDSDYSIVVPSVRGVTTKSLAEKFPIRPDSDVPQLVARALISDDLHVDPDLADTELNRLIGPLIDASLWPNLADLIGERPETLHRAATVLGTPTAPIVRRDDLGGRDLQRSCLLCIHRSNEERVTAALRDASVGFDTVALSDDEDSASRLCFYNLEGVVRDIAGRR